LNISIKLKRLEEWLRGSSLCREADHTAELLKVAFELSMPQWASDLADEAEDAWDDGTAAVSRGAQWAYEESGAEDLVDDAKQVARKGVRYVDQAYRDSGAKEIVDDATDVVSQGLDYAQDLAEDAVPYMADAAMNAIAPGIAAASNFAGAWNDYWSAIRPEVGATIEIPAGKQWHVVGETAGLHRGRWVLFPLNHQPGGEITAGDISISPISRSQFYAGFCNSSTGQLSDCSGSKDDGSTWDTIKQYYTRGQLYVVNKDAAHSDNVTEAAAHSPVEVAGMSFGGGQLGEISADFAQEILGILGAIPLIGTPSDVINGLWYLEREKYFLSFLSLLFAIPVIGIYLKGSEATIKAAATQSDSIGIAIGKVAETAGVSPAVAKQQIADGLSGIFEGLDDVAERFPYLVCGRTASSVSDFYKIIKLGNTCLYIPSRTQRQYFLDLVQKYNYSPESAMRHVDAVAERNPNMFSWMDENPIWESPSAQSDFAYYIQTPRSDTLPPYTPQEARDIIESTDITWYSMEDARRAAGELPDAGYYDSLGRRVGGGSRKQSISGARTATRVAADAFEIVSEVIADSDGRVFMIVKPPTGQARIFYRRSGGGSSTAEGGLSWNVVRGLEIYTEGYFRYIKDPGKILTPELKEVADWLGALERQVGFFQPSARFDDTFPTNYLQNIISNPTAESWSALQGAIGEVAKFNRWAADNGAAVGGGDTTGIIPGITHTAEDSLRAWAARDGSNPSIATQQMAQ